MSSIHDALRPLITAPSVESFTAICALFDRPLPDLDAAYAEAEQELRAWPRLPASARVTPARETDLTYRWTPERWFMQVHQRRGIPPAWGLCRTLHRHGYGTVDEDVEHLVASGALAQITDLDLCNGFIGPRAFAALEGSGLRFEVLQSTRGSFGPEVEVLATSTAFSSLRRLSLSNCSMPDSMALALAGSSTLTELVDLHLPLCHFSPAALDALCHTSNLPRLRTLMIGHDYELTRYGRFYLQIHRQMLKAPAPHIRRAWVRGLGNKDLALLAEDVGVKHKRRGFDREGVLEQILAAVDDGALDRVGA